MAKRIRIALPGYNANTDTDPNHYALYTDADYVLIKEKTRSSISVANATTQTVTHGLGYIPLVICSHEVSTGKYQKTFGYSIESPNDPYFYVTTTQVGFVNWSGSTKTFKYYIFYDRIE